MRFAGQPVFNALAMSFTELGGEAVWGEPRPGGRRADRGVVDRDLAGLAGAALPGARHVVSWQVTAFSARSARRGEDGAMRALVVEDEHGLRVGLRAGLEAEGFAVDVAGDGTDGLWLAREQPYDVIVLDIMLPGLNGYKVCAHLRRAGVWTPILMLTAKDGEWDEVEGLDTGADDYLTKPFSYAVLVARLRALLRRGARERPAVLAAGDLRLDPATRQVTRGADRVNLTPRELAMLEFLLRRRGEVLSKREILNHVWDYGFEGDPNIVEVYVGHLRNKLDRPFGRHAIETVRGIGYRLLADGG
jgi:two-component system OmpR family response regulator